jgi:hypothetical protein
MTKFIVPCVWSVLVVIGLMIHLSNPFREKHLKGNVTGFLWKKKAFVILPADYHQMNDAQKIQFWKTGAEWNRRRTMRSLVFTPLILIGGFLVLFLFSGVHISTGAAQQPTQAPTIVSTADILTTATVLTPETPTADLGTPTSTPWPTITPRTPAVVVTPDTP